MGGMPTGMLEAVDSISKSLLELPVGGIADCHCPAASGPDRWAGIALDWPRLSPAIALIAANQHERAYEETANRECFCAVVVLLVSDGALAKWERRPPAEFTISDIPAIVGAHNTNSLQFDMAYKGKSFSEEMVFSKIVRSSDQKSYRVSLRTGPFVDLIGIRGGIDCIVSDPRSLRLIASWQPGSWGGRLVMVFGFIEGVSQDRLILTGHTIRAVGGDAEERQRQVPISCD